jgi:hypothetical protein
MDKRGDASFSLFRIRSKETVRLFREYFDLQEVGKMSAQDSFLFFAASVE